METPEVARFRNCIIDGRWAMAEKALARLGVTEEEGLLVRNESFSHSKAIDDQCALGCKVLDQSAEVPGIFGSRKHDCSITCSQK